MDHFTTMLGNLEFIERREQLETVIEEIAYQPVLEREVILKRLTPSAASNPRVRSHFLKEARGMATLRHPNIAEVYDAGIDHNNMAFMILEKPDGISLEQRLDILNGRRARLDAGEVARIIQQVSTAIGYAHQHVIFLPNLSPANIILASSGQVILTGLGQPLPENVLSAPVTSLAYAAPERLFGGRVDAQSDVYSLGVLLYQLLFGRLPFEGNPLSIVAQKQVGATLSARNYPEIELYCPAGLAQVLRQATAQEPADRFAGVAAFRAAFDQAIPQLARPAPAVDQPIPGSNGHGPAILGTTAGLLFTAPVHLNGANGTNDANGSNGANGTNGSNGTNGNGRARVAQVVAPASLRSPAPAAEPAAEEAGPAGLVPETIVDPNTPGYDDPTLQAALPYTILVPMPQAPAETATASAPVVMPARPAGLKYSWLIWTSLAGLLAVLAAINFG